MSRQLIACCLTLWLSCCLPCAAQQDPKPEVRSNPNRPASADLLPENTVVYLQMNSVKNFVKQMSESSAGEIIANEKMAKLINGMYGEVKNQYEKVRDDVGVSLDDLAKLLTGEFCFAVTAFKDRAPGVVLLFDYDPESETLPTLLASGRKFAEKDGATFESTDDADVKIETVHGPDQEFFFFLNAGTFVGATDLELVKEMLVRWRGKDVEKIRPLSQNRKFITIMNRCRGTKDAPPELRGYVVRLNKVGLRSGRRSGKGNVEQCADETVWGVLYSIPDDELPALDVRSQPLCGQHGRRIARRERVEQRPLVFDHQQQQPAVCRNVADVIGAVSAPHEPGPPGGNLPRRPAPLIVGH